MRTSEIVVLKDGRRLPCGRLVYEDGCLVWERRVTEQRHLFRWGRAWDGSEVKDAWTVGEDILGQLRRLGVDRIRYVCVDCEPEAVYEVGVEDFLRQARELDQSEWSNGLEPQWALPRKLWARRVWGSTRQLALFELTWSAPDRLINGGSRPARLPLID